MLIGIPYHVALSYTPGKEWMVKSGEGVAGFAELAAFTTLFRMPTFFLIAGYFAAMLLARRPPGRWLEGRFRRLGIPILTSIIVLVPVMNWFCEISKLPMDEANQAWMAHSSRLSAYWIRHLWFIIVLLYYCCAIALLVQLKPELASMRLPRHIDRFVGKRLGVSLLVIAAVLGAWQSLVLGAFFTFDPNSRATQEILRLHQAISYAPWFLLGVLMQRASEARNKASHYSPIALAFAIAFGLLAVVSAGQVPNALYRFIEAFAALFMAQVLISLANRLFDRPIPAVQRVTNASFVIYLFHLPIICVLVVAGQYVPIPTIIKAMLVMVLAMALSYGAWTVIERHRTLALLFDGGMRPAPKPAANARGLGANRVRRI